MKRFKWCYFVVVLIGLVCISAIPYRLHLLNSHSQMEVRITTEAIVGGKYQLTIGEKFYMSGISEGMLINLYKGTALLPSEFKDPNALPEDISKHVTFWADSTYEGCCYIDVVVKGDTLHWESEFGYYGEPSFDEI